MGAPKGSVHNPSGRPVGAVNKFTATARQVFQMAFDGIGGVAALEAWAKENRTDFYKLYAKLVPIDINAHGVGALQVNIVRFSDLPKNDLQLDKLQIIDNSYGNIDSKKSECLASEQICGAKPFLSDP